MCDGFITSENKWRHQFPITIGLYQELALSTYLFVLVMDELTRSIQDEF